MFKIYYTDPVSDASHSHNVLTLTDALQYTEGWRRMGMTFVTMVSENPDCVGRPAANYTYIYQIPCEVVFSPAPFHPHRVIQQRRRVKGD